MALQLDAAPDETGYATPRHREHPVFPVDDADVLLMIDGFYNLLGYHIGFHQHRIMEVAVQKGGIYETWTDIGDIDVQTAGIGLLLQRLEIDVLHGLCG